MKVIVVHHYVPDPDLAGCDLRLIGVMEALRRIGHAVTFLSLGPSSSKEAVEKLIRAGIDVYAGHAVGFRKHNGVVAEAYSLREILSLGDFDLAILTLWFWSFFSVPELLLHEIRASSPQTRIAVLTDDRHAVRHRQVADITGSFIERECARDICSREAEIYRKADLVLAIAPAEFEHVLDLAPAVPCFVVPFFVSMQDQPMPYRHRAGLCFLGNFSNAANRDAVDLLLREILPRVNDLLPHVRLTIGGTRSREHFHDTSQVTVVGHVENLAAFFARHRVFVSPMTFGTGVSTKNVVALANGIPVITTSIGVQSLDVADNDGILIENQPDRIAKRIAALYEDEALWTRISCGALAFTRRSVSVQLLSRLHELMAALSTIEPQTERGLTQWSSRRAVGFIAYSVDEQHNRTKMVKDYCAAGDDLLEACAPYEAISQYRHGICFGYILFSRSSQLDALLISLVSGLARAYMAIDDLPANALCKIEVQQRMQRLCDLHRTS